MPEGPDGKTIIIVKKVSGHGGHHGGAWKVAYADFVTAMMALFLVLWLVNSASSPTKEAVASYFRRPGIFEKGSGTPLETGGAGILNDAYAPPSDEDSQVMQHKAIYKTEFVGERGRDGKGGGASDSQSEAEEQEQVEEAPPPMERLEESSEEAEASEEEFEFVQIAQQLQESVDQRGIILQELIGQVDVKVDKHGLVIEIMDTATASMFVGGTSRIHPEAEAALRDISYMLGRIPNPVDIEGHTDSIDFSGKSKLRYDNWDLSSDRANAARRILVNSGIPQERIARVVGYASQRPRLAGKPKHPSNRRISIAVRFSKKVLKAIPGREIKESVNPPPVIKNDNYEASNL